MPDESKDAIGRLLKTLCAEHDIAPVPRLEWSARMRRTLGRAYVGRGLIRLSAWLDDDQAHDTLRHELAHIAVGRSSHAPHGLVWQKWANQLGARVRARADRPPAHAPNRSNPGRYSGLECPNCGRRFVRSRVLRNLYCRACGPRSGTLLRIRRGDYGLSLIHI